jgi:ribosome-associated protein
MKDHTVLPINDSLAIPLEELRFQFSRSSGPGGQNVNRTATRVEVLFDVARSPSLSDEERIQILAELKSHVDRDGVLHLVSQRSRSQWRNRENVIDRFQELLRWALRARKRRKPTRPTRTSKERRLSQKRRRSEAKRARQRVRTDLE